MVNGALNMKHIGKLFCGVLLGLGLAGVLPDLAAAQGGTHWDTVCNCRRPDSQYTTKRVLRDASPRVVTRQRVITNTRVVRGNTRLIQENRLIVHVRPVINREVIVHRTNTIVRDVVLHRVNTTNRIQEEVHNQVVNVRAGGTTRHITEYRNVRGVNCNCGYASRGYTGDVVSYRD
jgi:hypothetical protein